MPVDGDVHHALGLPQDRVHGTHLDSHKIMCTTPAWTPARRCTPCLLVSARRCTPCLLGSAGTYCCRSLDTPSGGGAYHQRGGILEEGVIPLQVTKTSLPPSFEHGGGGCPICQCSVFCPSDMSRGNEDRGAFVMPVPPETGPITNLSNGRSALYAITAH